MESVNIAHIAFYTLTRGVKKSTNKPNVQAISIALVRGNVSHTKINASRRQNKRPLSELILYRFAVVNHLISINNMLIFEIYTNIWWVILASRIVAHNSPQLTQNIGGLPPASIRIFGRAFYLALFLPLPRNFWRLESRVWIF